MFTVNARVSVRGITMGGDKSSDIDTDIVSVTGNDIILGIGIVIDIASGYGITMASCWCLRLLVLLML